jgi:hypothetical protein
LGNLLESQTSCICAVTLDELDKVDI